MKHINANIFNVTNLWASVSKPFNGYASDGTISYSRIRNSEWPNKIWSNQVLTSETLENIKTLVKTSEITMRFIDFEYVNRTNNELIKSSGLEHTSSLLGMHLKLTNHFETHSRVHVKMVTKTSEAKVWSAVFKQSFDYAISENVIIKNMDKIQFYIAFDETKPIGAVKLHITKNIAGIYSLGVPKTFRGKGYAKEIMHFVLNNAMQQGATLATLQASKLGQGMYERMGFQKDFTMNSYKLKIQ